MGVRIVLLVLLAARVAAADQADDAAARFKHASALYNLERFDEAIKEFEAAYELDPLPLYLYNSAQANRAAKHYDRAIYLFKRYDDLVPDDPRHDKILQTIEDLKKAKADEEAAAKAAQDKALRDKIEADKAKTDRIQAEIAAAQLKEDRKHLRITLDVGFSIVDLRGSEAKPRAPAMGGRVGVAYIKKLGRMALDLGGSWQITTIPYTTFVFDDADPNISIADGTASALFTQLHGTAALTRTIAGPIWGRVGIGLGFSGFSNLQDGNPIRDVSSGNPNNNGGPDLRMYCVRFDTAIGYHYDRTIDFVLGLLSGSYSFSTRDLMDKLQSTRTLEGISLGLFLKV